MVNRKREHEIEDWNAGS